MAIPQLILIDGAPGLGKTTTACNLARAVAEHTQVAPILCHENDHPLHAFWTWGDGYDPHEVVTEPFEARTFIVRLLARTDTFMDRLRTDGATAVVETYPFQSPVRNMLKMLGSEADCRDYLRRFSDAVADADPLLVYFECPDWHQRILAVAEERGTRFAEIFFDAFYRSPWGRVHGAATPRDVLAFYDDYLHVCDRLLAQWPHRLLRCNPLALGREGVVEGIMGTVGV